MRNVRCDSAFAAQHSQAAERQQRQRRGLRRHDDVVDQGDVEQAVDLITERFGRGVVQPARLVEPPEIP